MSPSSGGRGLVELGRELDRALTAASHRIRLLARATPSGFRAEVERVAQAWASGVEASLQLPPSSGPELGGLDLELERLAERLDGQDPLAALYAARTRELALEARIAESLGGPRVSALAAERFGRRDGFDDDADEVAERWLAEPGLSPASSRVLSSDEHEPRSLVCRMREELGRRRLGVRVVVASDLGALAAAGDGVVQVAAGIELGLDDVERTVEHEIEGHLAPMSRARGERIGLYALGSARGSDDQEGWALTVEERGGHLGLGRRRELARRHLAARAVQRGLDFVEVVRLLIARGVAPERAARTAARSARGGGLAREAVYLGGWLRVRAALRSVPELEGVITRGRLSVEAARVLHTLEASG